MANINGTSANNTLNGTALDDTINGLAGADVMSGLAGNDVYIVDNVNDRVNEAVNKGTDTVLASVSYTLAVNVENLELTGVGAINATGNNLVNTLTGNIGNNTLDGKAGADLMEGLTGDDTYIVDNVGDVIFENFSSGTDSVLSSVDYTLVGEVENLTLTGTASINATGNSLDNTLIGNSGVNILDAGDGDDTLDGKASADTMIGGDGNDRYFVDNIGDVVVENVGEGDDSVYSSVSFILDANIESLFLTGTAYINATGNDGENNLIGNVGNNTLDGGLGTDTMGGGFGNDTYIVDDLLDVVIENASQGTDTVRTSVDYTLSDDVENVTITASGDINATGNASANVLTGGVGNNVLTGLAGNDTLNGGAGDDTMLGGADDDTYEVDSAGDSIVELSNEGTDTVRASINYSLGADLENLTLTGTSNIDGTGNGFNNTILGNAGNNTIDGGTGADVMIGGAGNDTYFVDDSADVVTETLNAGTDTVIADADYTLGAHIENLLLTGAAAIGAGNALDNSIEGNASVNTLSGAAGNDTLDGDAGADIMIGGTGNDSYYVDDTNDVVTELSGEGTDDVYSTVDYTLGSNVENLWIGGSSAVNATGNSGNNTITGNSAVNTLDGAGGVDTLRGGDGDDVYIVDSTTDVVVEDAPDGTADLVRATVSYTLSANVENLTFTDNLTHNGTGNAGDNTITGNSAVNTLDGKAGADRLIGGGSSDYYIVDNAGDVVVELVGEGTDTVESSVNYLAAAHVENVILTGSATSATGNTLDNVLTGNTLDNTLSGGVGADTMIGGAGNDTYFVDDGGDLVNETLSTGGGVDTVYTNVTYTATANVENVYLNTVGNLNVSGNSLDNILVGNGDDNTLDGKVGADTMIGGTGNDVYFIDNAGDVIQEYAAEGTDSVSSSISYTLAADLENVALTGSGNLTATGNASVNILFGNSGNNILDGQGSGDTMAGAAGNDTYYVDNAGDIVTENASEGTDTVNVSFISSYILTSDVENLVLGSGAAIGTGNALGNTITGNASNNTIDGGAGADAMIGGDGDDIYVVDNASDVVTETLNQGTDTIQSSVTYTASAHVENLTLTGTGDINATGNGLANTLTGNIGNNTLDGGVGADAMIGGAGNDTYIVDDASDVITELTGEGTDTVRASVNYLAHGFVENIVLTGTAISATGNTLVNIITGNSEDNTLDGNAGADTMSGGAGNDAYVVDNVGDVIIEASGTDTVYSSVDFTLATGLENLVMTGSALVGTGNAASNTITGNTSSNTIDGDAGADRMVGGVGNDLYYVDNAGDVVVELTGEGTADTVSSSIDYALTAEVESLILTGSALVGTGNALGNTITGNASNNTLDGGAGADTLVGGVGNDIYIVDNTSDIIVELTGEGTADTVRASVNYTAHAFVDNVVLTGTGNINATGNSGVNTLTGNAGNNTLDGAAGIDTMSGGAGNDTYGVDDTNDVIVENVGQGADTVSASITYALSANLENLTLTGSSDIDGTGTSLDNVITGNTGNNILAGLAGNDTIDGGVGEDEMIGGTGSDTYFVDDAADVVTELSGEGTDTVVSSISYVLGANLENLTLSGTADNDATGNSAVNILTGNSGNNTLDGDAGADIMIGGAGDDTYVVDVLGDNIVENAVGGGNDTVLTAISYILGAPIENLVLTGSASVNATGNSLNNYIEGNSGNNTLDGKGNADYMSGGDGDDVYIVDNVGDVTDEAGSTGIDTVLSSVSYTMQSDVERLTLTGSASINALGSTDDDTILGNSGNNTLNGGLGEDHLTGGLGNDTYVIDDLNDVIVENAGQGTDTVETDLDYTLQANLENLNLLGAAVFGTGNILNNSIVGNANNNTLDGGSGNDTLVGGLGDDTYLVDSASDVVTENGGAGVDTVISSAASYTLGANVENLELDASALNGTDNIDDNTITGNAGGNTLDGDSGTDTLIGGDGDDVYIVAGGDDTVIEDLNEGFDTVRSISSYTLGANIEALILTGTASVDATGNTLDNVLTGNSGNNTFNGDIGADTMLGGAGNDVYYVDNTGDITTEGLNQGNDSVVSTVSRTLAANIENLYLIGISDINATGNGLANTLVGNSGNNSLNGNGGVDYMNGGDGDDTYYVDVAGDIVDELGYTGNDLVESTISYTLGSSVENLTLAGSDNLNGTGNSLNNTLAGNSGNNTLDGSTGEDTMIGGDGNDIYIVDDSDDSVIELSGEGIDTVRSSVTYALEAFVDNAALTGTAANSLIGNGLGNTLTGNIADNTIDGGAGVDTMGGGAGNDTYYVDDSADFINEALNKGTDVVNASATYTLSANVEHLYMLGTDDINATGNALANTLVGNIGNNTLNGGAGADRLYGDDGDDTFVIDSVNDQLFDTSGTDTVLSSINHTLGIDFENLTLTGMALVGIGNAANNTIVGNASNNTLNGGTGVDDLIGGVGNDLYIVDDAGDGVFESLNQGTDTVRSSVTYGLASNVERLELQGSGNIHGAGNNLNNFISGNGGNNSITGGDGADTLQGGAGNDALQGDAGADLLTGGLGADTFEFELATAFLAGSVDKITDFNRSQGDALDISDLLTGFDPMVDAVTSFVRITNSGANSIVAVDVDGALNGANFVNIAILNNVTGLTDETLLFNNNHLIMT